MPTPLGSFFDAIDASPDPASVKSWCCLALGLPANVVDPRQRLEAIISALNVDDHFLIVGLIAYLLDIYGPQADPHSNGRIIDNHLTMIGKLTDQLGLPEGERGMEGTDDQLQSLLDKAKQHIVCIPANSQKARKVFLWLESQRDRFSSLNSLG